MNSNLFPKPASGITFPEAQRKPIPARQPSDFSAAQATDRQPSHHSELEARCLADVAFYSETRSERSVFDASMRALVNRQPENSMPGLKLVEFSLEKPDAKSVQLAADFTDWESSPIDMIRFGDGVWSTTVPLPPGVYGYFFLVDGQWHEDPRAMRQVNPPGGVAKALIMVK